MSIAREKLKSIGVFDSGLGGLTVVKELMRALPKESIVYFGDTARVPYGTKSKDSIVRFSEENTKVLLNHKVKMVVVACNSSSSCAIPHLRKKFNVPILGVIHPSAKKAALLTKNNRIGIIATAATISSKAYIKAIKKFNKKAKTYDQVCSLFVPLVEEGRLNDSISKDIAKEYLNPLKNKNVDSLILGCTHYPLLKTVISNIMGRNVRLIDSAKEAACEVKECLKKLKLDKTISKGTRYTFLISDRPQEFSRIARKFLGKKFIKWRLIENV